MWKSLAVLVTWCLLVVSTAQAHTPRLSREPIRLQARHLERNLAHSLGVVRFCDHHHRWAKLHHGFCYWQERAAKWQKKTLSSIKARFRQSQIVHIAMHYIGVPYVWGGESPSGFDCSGLVQYVYRKVGIWLPRTSYEQYREGSSVSTSELEPGDVVFFEPTWDGPGHVGIYIGGGRFIEAPHTGAVVRVRSLQDAGMVGARRYR